MFTIEMLHANEGDALWIEYGPPGGVVHRVLVDCGRKSAYRMVRDRIKAADDTGVDLRFDLFILTHVDDDHIFGAVPLLGDERFTPARVNDVWFNGWRHLNGEKVPPTDALGAQNGEYFAGLLRDHRFSWNAEFCHRPIVVPADGPLPSCRLEGGMQLTLLSPTWPCLEAMREEWVEQLNKYPPGDPRHVDPGDAERALEVLAGRAALQPDALGADWLDDWDPDAFEDYASADFREDGSPANGSSIAVLAEYDGKAALLGGDAFPSVVIASLKRFKKERTIQGRIRLDAVKVPHHGSENNLDSDLVSLVDCKKWLFSTNGSTHHHPNPVAVARVIDGVVNPALYFNWRSEESEVWDEDHLRGKHSYQTFYGASGLLTVGL